MFIVLQFLIITVFIWKSDHGVSGSNPADGKILSEANRRFIAQGLSCLPFRCPDMTEIRLKGT